MNLNFGAGFEKALFKNPPADCRVSYSWLWNTPITKEGIDRGLEEIKAAGVGSIYILPLPIDFRPERTRTYMSPDYLTPEFWELVEYSLRKAVELGITPWLYDEGGWPSGSACGRTLMEYPESLTMRLNSRAVTLKAGEKFSPDDGFIALFDKKRRIPDDFTAAEEITLTEYFAAPTDEPAFLDYTDPKFTETFINNSYEAYKKAVGDLFGDTIPLIFTDEPGIKQGTLPKDFGKKFKDRYGYAIEDYIYVVMGSGEGLESEEERVARIDYLNLVGDLFIESTFDKLSVWCEKAGIAYAGHLMADNYPDAIRCGYFSQLDTLRRFHIPGVDAIWEQIRYPYGGREPYDATETARMPFFPRLAPSAARQMGRNISLTEAMGIYGDGITPDEIKFVTNYHIIRGINYISYAHIPFSGSRFSALATRPDFRPEKPGFFNLGHINEYFARLSYLARLGYAEGDTALYHPTRDYAAGKEISDLAVESYKNAGVRLEEENIPFDIIDDKGILDAEITDGGLKLGAAVYRHITVPENRYMPKAVSEKIAPFIGEGEPTYKFKNDKLRVMTRRLDNGRLWFIFNEGEPTVSEELHLGEGNIYRFDCQNGEIFKENTPCPTLLSGDIAVYLITDEAIECENPKAEYTKEISGFKPIAHKKLVITYDGLGNEYGDGNVLVDDEFSGEITYLAKYSLESEPLAGERYEISLEDFSLTASVKLGAHKFSLGMSPMRAIIDGALLKKEGEIEITVANTSLNEIKKAKAFRHFYPKAEIGPYIERIEEFEENPPKLKFGRVFISKMKN